MKTNESAAQCERMTEYKLASELWEKSAQETDNEKQKQWCIDRAKFCKKRWEIHWYE